MSIYEKYVAAKMTVAKAELTQSGKNTYSGYRYYELSDIMPIILQALADNKLASVVTFDKEMAKLNIVDAENPKDFITFTSPMESASLKGCHAIQNLGAVETYQRRYLYMIAFDINDGDQLNETSAEDEFFCDRCGKQITAGKLTNIHGEKVTLTAKEIATKSKKDYKETLCGGCYHASLKISRDEAGKRIIPEG